MRLSEELARPCCDAKAALMMQLAGDSCGSLSLVVDLGTEIEATSVRSVAGDI
jgi:hypothetical protein